MAARKARKPATGQSARRLHAVSATGELKDREANPQKLDPQAHRDSMPVDAIRVGHRHRKDMGDIDALARAIEELGHLLHPVVVRADGTLIAGARRLRAIQLLGWKNVPVTHFESLFPAPRYADLFSRYQHNERWDCHGNEAPLDEAEDWTALDFEAQMPASRNAGREPRHE